MAVLSRLERLRAYLRWVAREPLSYGVHDCLLGLMGGWVLAETGRDPAAPFRGRYRTEIGAYRLIRRAGGMIALVDEGLAAVGIDRTVNPALGDVGLVEVGTSRGPELVGAIRTSVGWASLKQPRGIKVGQPRCAAAWAVPELAHG